LGRSRASIGAPSAATGEAGPQAEALAWEAEAAAEAEAAEAAEATERAGAAWGSTAFRAISRPFPIGRALDGPLLPTVRAAERVREHRRYLSRVADRSSPLPGSFMPGALQMFHRQAGRGSLGVSGFWRW
jgi:hypothetical protein